MKHPILLILSATLAVAFAQAASASNSSKPVDQKAQICRDKLAAKHVTKANWKAEHDKCFNDPINY